MSERAKVIEAAERLVEQWDTHDKYRETEADKALREGFDEPPEVAIARKFLETTRHFEPLSEDDGMSETWDEKLSRVRSMVRYRESWQLSPNDQASLLWVLGMLNALVDEVASLRGTERGHEQQQFGELVNRIQSGRTE